MLLEAYPQFKTPYYLKETFRNSYQFAETREEAEQMYAKWVQANADEDCCAFGGFISTVGNWYTEIFNCFDNRYIPTANCYFYHNDCRSAADKIEEAVALCKSHPDMIPYIDKEAELRIFCWTST